MKGTGLQEREESESTSAILFPLSSWSVLAAILSDCSHSECISTFLVAGVNSIWQTEIANDLRPPHFSTGFSAFRIKSEGYCVTIHLKQHVLIYRFLSQFVMRLMFSPRFRHSFSLEDASTTLHFFRSCVPQLSPFGSYPGICREHSIGE